MQNNTRLTIWVCEFVSAGGLAAEPLPASLLQEGLLMRDALLADLSALAVDCITSHDVRVPAPADSNISSQPVGAEADPWQLWQQQLQDTSIDAVWVIAPETAGILSRLHALAIQAGKRWIGCQAEAIAIASSKAKMAEQCGRYGIAVIPHQFLSCWTASDTPSAAAACAWVVKPDDGAGCEYTFLANSDQQLQVLKKQIQQQLPEHYTKMLVQPYMAGQALSMSVIATEHAVKVIAAHTQFIRVNGDAFHFEGAGIHQASQHLAIMQGLAEQLFQAIPGLTAYWGADLIFTEKGELLLVEINPRLTTPYSALSKVLAYNPAAAILSAVFDHQLPASSANQALALQLAQVETPAAIEVCHG